MSTSSTEATPSLLGDRAGSDRWQDTILRSISLTLIARLALMAINTVLMFMVTRILGPEGRGDFALAMVVANLGVQLGNLGLHSANTYFLAREPQQLRAIIGNCWAVLFAVMAVACGLGTASAIIPDWFPVQGPLLWFALSFIPLMLAVLLVQNLLLAMHKVRAFNAVDILISGVNLLILVLLFAAGSVEIVWVFAAGWLANVAGLLFAAHQLGWQNVARAQVNIALLHKCLPFALKGYVACLLSFLVIRSDLLMIEYLRGDRSEVGLYSVAVGLAELLQIVPLAVGTILYPRLAAIESIKERWQLTLLWVRRMALILLPMGVLLIAFPTAIIHLCFGPAFVPAAQALRLLTPGVLALSLNGILMNFLAASNMPSIVVWAPLAALVLNLVLNAIGIPIWGMNAAATSSTLAYLLLIAITFVYCRNSHIGSL